MARSEDTESSLSPAASDGERRDRAEREAVEWSLLLLDDPDDADLKTRFDVWLACDAYNRRAWDEVENLSNLIAQTRKVALLPAGKVPPQAVVRSWPAVPQARLTHAAMAAAIALALGWALLPRMVLDWKSDHVTGTAEQQTITLADGSTVRLAPDSSMNVTFAENQRAVKLLGGEAYFEVAPDAARPFKVEAGNTHVTVLGTGFNVRLGDPGADVSVRHGRVQVAANGGNVILTAGQRAHVDGEGQIAHSTLAPDLAGSWSDRTITAVDRPLAEVLADLRRYHSGAIVLTNEALGRKSVTGTFDAADPAAAAAVIVRPHGGVVRRITPWLIVISAS